MQIYFSFKRHAQPADRTTVTENKAYRHATPRDSLQYDHMKAMHVYQEIEEERKTNPYYDGYSGFLTIDDTYVEILPDDLANPYVNQQGEDTRESSDVQETDISVISRADYVVLKDDVAKREHKGEE